MKYVKITIIFEQSRITLEIDRVLFWNYFAVWVSTENAMKVEQYRMYDRFNDIQENIERFFNLNKDRFDTHEKIFNAIKISHRSADFDYLEFYVQIALDHWLVEIENKRKEPCEYKITLNKKSKREPILTVMKHRKFSK